MMEDEKVMCVRDYNMYHLEKLCDNIYSGGMYSDEVAKYVEYIPRSQAETDERYRQLIPYVLFVSSDRRDANGHKELSVFVYRRTKKVGEQRLAGKMSVGFGGHVRYPETWREGRDRELLEEVGRTYKEKYDAAYNVLINRTAKNNVNNYHVGILQHIHVHEGSVHIIDPELEEVGWKTLREIDEMVSKDADILEDWSMYSVSLCGMGLLRFLHDDNIDMIC